MANWYAVGLTARSGGSVLVVVVGNAVVVGDAVVVVDGAVGAPLVVGTAGDVVLLAVAPDDAVVTVAVLAGAVGVGESLPDDIQAAVRTMNAARSVVAERCLRMDASAWDIPAPTTMIGLSGRDHHGPKVPDPVTPRWVRSRRREGPHPVRHRVSIRLRLRSVWLWHLERVSHRLEMSAVGSPVPVGRRRGASQHGNGRLSGVSLKQARVGMLLAAAAGIAFGSAPVGTVFQLRSFEPLAAAAWRAGIGAIVLAMIVSFRSPSTLLSKLRDLDGPAFRRLVVLGLLGGPTFLFGLNIAVSEVGASISGLVTGMYAVFAAVIAPYLLSEPLEVRAVGGLALALVGTVMLAALDVGGVGLVGVGAGLLGAVGNAFYLVLGRKWMRGHGLPPELVALSFATVAALTFLVYVGITDAGALWPDDVRTDSLVALAYLAAVLVGGQLLMMAAVKRIHSRRSASLLLLNPLTAAVLGAWILDERLTGPQLAGAALVLVGIALGSGVTVKLRRRSRSDPIEELGPA